MNKLLVCLAILPGLLAADTYKVKLSRPARVGTNMLAAGEYKVVVDGSKAEFQQGKNKYSADVTQDKLDKPAPQSYVRYAVGAEDRVAEIVVRGSKVCLRFQ
jgi:hypothetical protein